MAASLFSSFTRILAWGSLMLLGVLSALPSALSGAAAPPASEPPIMMSAMSVMESVMKINVTTTYYRFPIGGEFATSMLVSEVRTPSFAYDAGVRKGMEIVAINGTKISGLSQGEITALLGSPKQDAVVLLIRGGGKKKPGEIRIPLKSPEEETKKK